MSERSETSFLPKLNPSLSLFAEISVLTQDLILKTYRRHFQDTSAIVLYRIAVTSLNTSKGSIVLIKEGYLAEAQILLRSLLEYSQLLWSLTRNPSERQEWLSKPTNGVSAKRLRKNLKSAQEDDGLYLWNTWSTYVHPRAESILRSTSPFSSSTPASSGDIEFAKLLVSLTCDFLMIENDVLLNFLSVDKNTAFDKAHLEFCRLKGKHSRLNQRLFTELTLNEAIKRVITATGRPMCANEIAAQVNAQALYRRRDGRPVESSQICARVNKYPKLFSRQNGRIGLISQERKQP